MNTAPAQSQFYKTFTRPIAKVLLLAVFTYQVVYWSWMKLEADEVREERNGTPMTLAYSSKGGTPSR